MKRLYSFLIMAMIGLSTLAQVSQTVIVEHFTNTRCSTCANRNPALFNLLDGYPDVLHIAYHPSSPYSSCVFHQHNPVENDGRTNYYSIYGATPRVVMQGEVVPFGSQLLTMEQLESQLGMLSDYSIEITQNQTKADEVEVKIMVENVSGTAGSKIQLYAAVVEKTVNYAAPNGENVHHDVFRSVLLSQEITVPAMSETSTFTESYTLDEEWIAEEMMVVLMLQDNASKAILQSGASDLLGNPSSIGESNILDGLVIAYPNPVIDVLSFDPAAQQYFSEAQLFNMHGQLIRTTRLTTSMNRSDLPQGQYILMLRDERNVIEAVKIQKR